MGNVIAIEEAKPTKTAHRRKSSLYLEDPKAQYLFTGTDEQGKKGYFFKMQISGLRDRIFGPYDSRSMAVECFDTVLEGALESFCEVENIGRHGIQGTEHIALPENLTPVPVR